MSPRPYPAVDLTGPPGLQGDSGEPGTTGPPGADGPPGPPGVPGNDGAAGPPGDAGAAGSAGAQGPTGDVGSQGPPGNTGPSGDAGVQGPPGIQGPPGTDPWTYVKLASDFPTSSATAVPITGLAFTPIANTQYRVEGVLFTRTATTSVGPRPGIGWPTGLTDGVATIRQASSATAVVVAQGNSAAAVLAPVGGLPSATLSYPAEFTVDFRVGASPSGTLKIQLASETAGTVVTAKAGSYLRYRVVP